MGHHRFAWVALGLLGAGALLASCGQDVAVFTNTPTGTVHTGGGGTTTHPGGGGTGGTTTGSAGQAGDCPAGYSDCDGNPATPCDTDIWTDTEHCGGCDQLCGAEHASPVCTDGFCNLNCQPPYASCDDLDANGCEADTSSSLEDCGGCDEPCATQCVLGDCIAQCDEAVAMDEHDPALVLRSIGLCTGVQSPHWVLPDGAPPPADATALTNFHLGHGVLPDFGANVHPQQGSRLLALSTGTARRPGDAGYQPPVNGYDKGYTCSAPPGYPKVSPACPGITPGTPHDATGIELSLTVPAQAGGFALDFKYYAADWPDWVCTQFADQFLALLAPAPPSVPDGNVVFDAQGNTIGAHTSFIDVCGCQPAPPCTAGGLQFPCALGQDELQGTGYEQHGATAWLEASVPAAPNATITLRLVVYDSADGIFDSTTLIDNFHWIASPGAAPVTVVLPDPL